MDREREVKKTHSLVKLILTECPQARNSDTYLYYKVVEKLNPVALHRTFEYTLLNQKELGLPCFETVRRTRAKIQAANPDLQSSEPVHSFRSVNEEIMRDYARS